MTQVLFNGLIQGVVFGVVGVAFSLVFATTGVFYIALGGIFVVAPYVALSIDSAGAGWALALLGPGVIGAVVGVASEELIHWPLVRRRAPSDVHLIASLGAFLALEQAAILYWGSGVRVLWDSGLPLEIFGEVRITLGQLLSVVVGASGIALLFFCLARTDLGLQLRALSSNAVLLSTLGRDIRMLRRVVFALSGTMVALMSVAVAADVGFDPNTGMSTILVGIAATIVAGRGAFGLAAVVGVLFGLLRAVTSWGLSSGWEDAVTFAVLALSMLALPGGLQGGSLRSTRVEDRA